MDIYLKKNEFQEISTDNNTIYSLIFRFYFGLICVLGFYAAVMFFVGGRSSDVVPVTLTDVVVKQSKNTTVQGITTNHKRLFLNLNDNKQPNVTVKRNVAKTTVYYDKRLKLYYGESK